MDLMSPIVLFCILFLGPLGTSFFVFLAFLCKFGQVIVDKDELYEAALRHIETLKVQVKEERERTLLLMSEASTKLEDADRLVELASVRLGAAEKIEKTPKKRSRAKVK